MIPVLKSFNSNKNSNSKITFIAFTFFQLCFGYDFGCFKYRSNKIKLLVKFFCVLQSILLSVSTIAPVYYTFNLVAMLWMCVNRTQYIGICFVFLTNFSQSNTICEFQNDLNCIDVALNSNEANKSVTKRKILVLILFVMHRVTISTYFAIATDIFTKSLWAGVVTYMIVISTDFIIFCNIFALYSIYCRLYLLT